MQSSIFGRFAVLAALTLLITGHETARATPLADAVGSQPVADVRPVRPLSESEIVSTGTLRPDDELLSPRTTESVVQHYLRGTTGEAGNSWLRDSVNSFDLGWSVGSPLDTFRSLVNAPRGDARSAAPRKGTPADDGLTLGPETREWIDDTVRGIVNSVVELRTNEQGRTSFSVLGMGDLGIMMSADRNEVALVAGDDVLLTANRMPLPVAQGASNGFYEPITAWNPTAAPVSGSVHYALQRMIDALQETAAHPLSMLVYAIVIGFVVLWNVLTAQTKRHPTRHARASPSAARSRRSLGKHRSRKSRSRRLSSHAWRRRDVAK